jgi:hypothetical protein
MPLTLRWTPRAAKDYESLKSKAEAAAASRGSKGRTKSSKAEGLFKQVNKALRLLRENPKHPGLNTHEYSSLAHPHDKDQKVLESYIQNNTPGAYRLFWCYGPVAGEATIIAITPHP